MKDRHTTHSTFTQHDTLEALTVSADPVNDPFVGGGEMGAIMRATDWSKTKLGPVESWPKSLKTMLGVILGSRFPMLLWWGPDLLHLYNDAYRPILRDKHPASLAAPAAEVWAEVWDVAGPMAQGVQEGGPATWTEDLQLFIHSGNMAEETYFTFSYSPVPGDDGRVGGILNTVQETTAKVQGERQIRMLHELAAQTGQAKSEGEAFRIAAEVLGANELDLPFTLIYALDEKGDSVHLVASSGWSTYEGPAKPFETALQDDAGIPSWPFAEVIRSNREVIVEDLSARFGPLPMGRWAAPPERAVVLPLGRSDHARPYALLVAGVSPHRSLDDRYKRFFLTTADQVANVIASARAYEAEKNRAEALAEIDRAKTVFFSNVSHEFRTPLTLILGPIEDALDQAPQSLQGENLEVAHRNALRLLRLVNSLLDFARIESGRLQLSFAPTDLPTLTADLASSFRSLFDRAGLQFVVDCPPLPEAVYVDPAQWEKIVLNLLSNAFKFTLKGSITLSLRAHGTRAELTVRDTGIGIPAHELPHIFERFHRVEGAKGRSFEGTGIGLSLVQELVKLHGGLVRAWSAPGEGSSFSISLPFGTAHLPADQISTQPAPRMAADAAPYLSQAAQWIDAPTTSAQATVQRPSGHLKERGEPPARILIADDNEDMREYLARLLGATWQVETVENGQQALASTRDHIPDLVLTDIMMPGMTGIELLRELRAHPRTSRVPVVLLSARSGEEAVLEGLDTGADDYLCKPFAARELLARVRTHLNLARLRREWMKQLEEANQELEAFSYSVSHDLRSPLRAIDGFSDILQTDHAASLDEKGRHCIARIRAGAQRMSQLIEDLLGLSQIARVSLSRQRVDVSSIAHKVLMELQEREPQRDFDTRIQEGLEANADPRLVRVLLDNLLGNAWKYSSKQPKARIDMGYEERDGESVFFVRDNGAGFDMAYAKKLFTPFQRLHTEAQFPGTGIGLAIVHRIITRHGGRVWAESAPDEGATFYFTLGGNA
jgi:signal transduction histidine kinase